MVLMVLLVLLDTAHGLRTQTVSEGAEVLLQWDAGSRLRSLHISCHFSPGPGPGGLSPGHSLGPPRLVLEVQRGEQRTSQQDPQFWGRVSCSQGPQGEVTVHLTRVTLRDSGSYTCDSATRTGSFKTEDFELRVDGPDSDAEPHGPEQTEDTWSPQRTRMIPVVVVCLVGLAVVALISVIKFNDQKLLRKLTDHVEDHVDSRRGSPVLHKTVRDEGPQFSIKQLVSM
ncbi:unnamed protein product [Knipowitschia caucasica]